MPELPEVETVRQGLIPALVGHRIDAAELRRGDLRRPFPPALAAHLTGRTVTGIRRRAKYLLADLDNGQVLIVHLGMSGSIRIERDGTDIAPGGFHHPRGRPGAHDHVILRLDDGTRLVYNDPRRFGLMELLPAAELEQHPLFRHLGLEPLSSAFGGVALARCLARRKTSIKAALLDQRLIAGVGNIYACEALWAAGISPRRQAGALVRQDGKPAVAATRLAAALRAVLEAAVAAGGSSLRDHRRTDGSPGAFQHRFSVYDREGQPCPKPGCRGTVRRIVQGGRSTFYCPDCQR